MRSRSSIRTYSELSRLKTFEERFNYLRESQVVGESIFGSHRWLNQSFYNSYEWRTSIRNMVIVRDNGCDLGVPGKEIILPDRIYIHHINPLSIEDLEDMNELVTDPEYLICCSFNTHQAIHYGDSSLLSKPVTERKPNDTCPWKL